MPITKVTGQRPRNMKMMLKRLKLIAASDSIEQFSYNRKINLSPAMRSYLASYNSIEGSLRWKNDYYDIMAKNIERLIAYYKIYDRWKTKKTGLTSLSEYLNKRAVFNMLRYIENISQFIIDDVLLGEINITDKDMKKLLANMERKFDSAKEIMQPLFLAEKIKE